MLKVLFAGTPECAIPVLEAVAQNHQIVGILTNAPAPQGRSGKILPSPIAAKAEELRKTLSIPLKTPIFSPEKITDECRAEIAEVHADILVCFAFGKILHEKTLSLFPLGGINLHPSLLPRWRGCAPVPAAILAGDSETGITVQTMVKQMDAGDILAQKIIPLTGTETSGTLLDFASKEGALLMIDVLSSIEKGSVSPKTQDHNQATYCTMLKKEDGRIQWNKSAKEIDAQIRAFSPWPGTSTQTTTNTLLIHRAHVVPIDDPCTFSNGVKITADCGLVIGSNKAHGILVQTADGILAVEELQWKTKKSLDWKSFLNGSKDFIGTRFMNY